MNAMNNNRRSPAEQQTAWRPRVLVLDDEWATLERIKTSLGADFEISVASRAQEAMQVMNSRPFDVLITDVRMPDMDGLTLVSELKSRHPETQYIIMTAFSDIEDTISAIRLGVADYLRKPFTMSEVRHALNRCLESQRLKREVASLRAGNLRTIGSLVASSEPMQEVLHLAETVAATDATVLISGETGTGKGLLAQAIHNASPRRDRPFVEINCAAIPATLIESELFGHERGSFTGAVSRKLGRVETASGGTLLLDEIGELPLEMQSKLLRFLQNFHFERVGGNKRLTADVRVIAATNRLLRDEVQNGSFRQDLYYRLHVVHLHLPPLRERSEDIPHLAETFLQRFSIKYGRQVDSFSPLAYSQIMNSAWPGNVRELEHSVERAVILCRGRRIERLELDPFEEKPAPKEPDKPEQTAPPPPVRIDLKINQYMASCERRYLEALLSETKGSVQETARQAGINPKTLYLKMNRYGLSKMDYRMGRDNSGENNP